MNEWVIGHICAVTYYSASLAKEKHYIYFIGFLFHTIMAVLHFEGAVK